jgi:Glycine cleavage system P-protein
MMADGNEMSADAYDPYDFANRRHIGPSPEEIAEMLRIVGASSLDALIDETVPKDIRLGKALDLDRPLSERDALDRLRETANKNRVLTSLIGQGYHGTIMPPRTLLDLVEEPLDHITSAIEVGAEADRFPAISFWRDVRPRAAPAGERPNPVGVISTISEQHCPRFEIR